MRQVCAPLYEELRTAPKLADRLGSALSDRYRIEREIGRGGMSVVYLGQDLIRDRDVAIKALRPELALAGQMARFLQEIQITARLVHPHILPLHDSGNAEGILYYVMPFVESGSLRDRLRQERALPLPEVIELTRQIADALDYAHAVEFTSGQGVVHRDIKPENVLVARGGHAYVADFGIARLQSIADGDRLSEYGIIVGTRPYMSPEQCAGERELDYRTDIYALGCVVYEMLAGEPPFTGPSNAAISAKHLHERPPSLRVIRPEIPEYVQHAVEKALAKSPADRYKSAGDLVTALSTPVRPPIKIWRVAAVVSALIVAALGVWALLGPPAVPLDANKVVVFPLMEHNPRGEREGNEVALLIGSALEHTEPLRWIDGWTWLDSAHRADAGAITPMVARRIAKDRNARFYIDGSILRIKNSTTVILRLNDVAGDSLLAQTSAAAPMGQAAALDLGLRAINEMLPRLLEPGRRVDLRALAERHPAAIASWLQGEKAYRESDFQTALGYYRRAFETDSALGFAAIKATQAAMWGLDTAHIKGLLDTALTREALLAPKQMHLARGLRFFLAGSADSAVGRFRQALSLDPTWADAWMLLGEVYLHLLPRGYALDSMAEVSFLEARRSDPGFAPPLFHLSEIVIRKGLLDSADRLIGTFEKSHAPNSLAVQLDLMIGCARSPSRFAWSEAAISTPKTAMNAAKELSSAPTYHMCAERGFREVMHSPVADLSTRWGGVMGLQSVLVAHGRDREAGAVIDSALVAGMWWATVLYVSNAVSGADMQQQAAAVMTRLGTRLDTMSTRSVWQYGIWAAHKRDSAGLSAAARAFDQHVGLPGGGPLDGLLRDAMLARLAVLRADTNEAVRRLQALVPVGPPGEIQWRPWEPLAEERLLLARLLLAQGKAAEAIDVASVFDHPQPIAFLGFLRSSLSLRLSAAMLLGNNKEAARYRGRLGILERSTIAQSN